MELANITEEIYQAAKRLEEGCGKIFAQAKRKAEAEKDYRKALAIEIVKLKDEKLQATLIPDVARGNLADLKYQRDVEEALYDSTRDVMKSLMNQISALQSILKNQSEV